MLFLNGISIINICAGDLLTYKNDYDYSQQNITEIYDNAVTQITNGQNITLMKKIAESFRDRQWDYRAYDSRELDYVGYTRSIYMMIIIMVIITARSFGVEREKNMNKVVSVALQRDKRLYHTKLKMIIITCVILSVIFL